MAKNLVIVESPAKVKTIGKFLGSTYHVTASMGHVRDFPKSSLGFDEQTYEPRYITIRGKGDLLAGLRKEVKKAEKIYLATDPDREGEAISWHLTKALKLEGKKVYRITFNEITKTAVKESIKNARSIDMDLVDAQQARRMLDRMVGYRISPLLWAKVKRGLSAGRVQSVALRIICDREDEISSFIPKEYWTIDANLNTDGGKKPLTAHYYGKGGKKAEIGSRAQVDAILSDIGSGSFTVSDIKRGERTKNPPLPFTTSTLQQEAGKVLNFATSKTMRIAQQLYEGVDIKGSGTVGIITYLRTDSTRVSDEAMTAANDYISHNYGKDYAAKAGTGRKTGNKIQDAHEAIRPTDIARTPESIKDSLSKDQYRLYQLIWKRFAASRMTAAKYGTVSVKINNNGHIFTAAASSVIFDGFTCIYTQEDEEKTADKKLIDNLAEGAVLEARDIAPEQHFTQPPAHYTEAGLVKALEEEGIGRPSTYAPTITTLLGRRYITKEQKNIYVTELGDVVNGMMKQAFPDIVDVHFTADMEKLLDKVEEGDVEWKSVVSDFYPGLDAAVNKAEDELDKVKIADEVTEEVCEECGRNMVVKYGPHGKFLACPGFPECRNTKPFYEKIGVMCPKCGKDIVIRQTRKGRRYYGCIDNPDCDFMVWQRPSGVPCAKCGGITLIKGDKLVCNNPECGNVMKREK